MINPWVVFAAFCLYVGILFSLALWVERKAAGARSPANNAWVYSLSLAVYCTAWTYYGSVGKAATSGALFLPIYLGPTLSILTWWLVLRKLVRLKAAHKITSIADFISARYNKSQLLAAVATGIAIVGIMPYIALQLKAMISTFLMIAEVPASQNPLVGWVDSMIANHVGAIAVVLMTAFTIILGVRHLDPTERHEGMVMALAAECLVKLLAFLAAGIFVTYFLYDGFTDIFQKIEQSEYRNLVHSWGMGAPPYVTWTSYLVLSMSAILFLPRQFHVAVVENRDERHILTTMWLFPLYMLLINIFVLPIAVAGLLKGYPIETADTFVLRLPLHHGEAWLSLLVFLGGVSASAGMIMVSSITIATMTTNHLLLPVIGWVPRLGFLKRYLLECRWGVVAGFIGVSYWFEEIILKPYMLVNIGLISFTAVVQFAPVILGGIFWRRGNRAGALLGLGAGFLVWCYTQLLPSFVRNGWLSYDLLEKGPAGVGILRPEALLHLSELDPISHTLVWSLLLNVSFYVLGSLCFEQEREEQRIAEQFVGIPSGSPGLLLAQPGEAYIDLGSKAGDLQQLLSQYFPVQRASEMLDGCLHEMEIHREAQISVIQLVELHNRVEKSLAASIGAAAAYKALHEGITFDPRESKELAEVYAEILANLKVTPTELQEKIDYYQEREKLLTRHAEELKDKVDALQSEITQRMRVQEALTESEERFRELVETMAEGLEIEDPHGIITYVNDRLCDLWGCRREEIIGGLAAHFLVDTRSEAAQERRETLLKGEIACYEATWRAKDGRKVPSIVSAVPLFDAEGAYKGCFSVITDISIIKAFEREKANLISMFAHDMRSSLTGIHGLGIRLLTRSDRLDDREKEHYLQVINKEASKLESLVDDFLEFSRLETGRLKLNFEIVSLEDELRELFDLYQPRAFQRGIRLKLQIRESLPPIQADANRLRRVFTNLLDNALKFSKKTGTVTIMAEDAGRELVVSISDQGIGIDPEDIPFIFDIFHRTQSEARREGYGIGLATVKAIVEAHCGKVRVESELGKGSRFTVFLPKTKTQR